jgi:dihydrofolate reductase/thymidylate synthase
MISLIVCVDSEYGIGKSNELPWYLPEDLKHFRNITNGHTVVMGRKTWESIPDKFKPLSNRENIVLSKSLNDDRCLVFNDELELIKHLDGISNVFIIGGSQLYNLFLKSRLVNKIYMTRMPENHYCDTLFPKEYMKDFKEINKSLLCKNVYVYEYEFTNQEEQQYLDVLKDIVDNGTDMLDRTGVGTRSVFVKQMKFDLRDNTIPLLTTKRVFFRGIVEETLFFLSGSTDVRKLRERGVFYWDANTSKEFLKKRGLPYEEYDMGSTYSFLYRYFGTEYQGMDKDYTGKGFDQVQYVIDEIKNNPTSRRIMINVWDPNSLDKASLPPCMFCMIFYVNTKTNEISMNTIIRSSDGFLGLCFNLINASVILRLICHCTGYNPGDLYVITNNTHIYQNHFEAVQKQLQRMPNRTFPKMLINTQTKNIFEITFDDFQLLHYNPQPNIKAPMAV